MLETIENTKSIDNNEDDNIAHWVRKDTAYKIALCGKKIKGIDAEPTDKDCPECVYKLKQMGY